MSGLGLLYPSIRLAHILQTRSHSVLFVSAQEFKITLANYGIEHIAIKSTKPRQFLDLHRWGNPENVLDDYKAIEVIVQKYRPDVIVTNPLAMISFMFAEKYQIPIINIGFSEYLFPGKLSNDPIKKWRMNLFAEIYNSCCTQAQLSLNERRDVHSLILGEKYLLRSVPELNDDILLPDNLACVGDLYLEPTFINKPLYNFIAASKEAGRKIGYIQMGRLFKHTHIWESLLSVLVQLPINFIIDIGRADYSTASLRMSHNFFTAEFIPIGAIKNDIDFVICTAQTTTVVSAIIHDKQMLLIPHSADSIELAKRLESKKLALVIYDAADITTNKILELLSNLDCNYLMPSTVKYRKLFQSYTDEIIYEIIKSI